MTKITKLPPTFPTKPGANFIDVDKYKDILFDLDNKIISSTTHSFPFKDVKELVDFYTVEHKTTTFLWCNENNEVVGYLSYIEEPDNEGRVEMLNIGVLPSFQGKGYGTQMMEYYFDLMQKRAFNKSKLMTSPNNEPAKRLYEKLGYVNNTGILKDYYGPDRDRILYIKEL
jgi:ribosomal protein S18 acetylase RimI-like enzyme